MAPEIVNKNKKLANYLVISQKSLEFTVTSFTSFHKFLVFIDTKFKGTKYADDGWKSLLIKLGKDKRVIKAFLDLQNHDEIHNFHEKQNFNRSEIYSINELLSNLLSHNPNNPQVSHSPLISPLKILKIIQNLLI